MGQVSGAMFEPLQLDSMQPDSYSSGASDDEYDETCDASAQVFSPRGAEGVDDLLEANPFSDSEGDNDEIESCEIDYTEETIGIYLLMQITFVVYNIYLL